MTELAKNKIKNKPDIKLYAQTSPKWIETIKTDFETLETNVSGVFAAGDIVRGASLVVWAIKDGRDAAESIIKHLKHKQMSKIKVA